MIRPDIPTVTITKELIRSHLSDHPTVIEAGAHIGRDTLKMAKLWPDAIIYAFEPVPKLFLQLKERTKDFANVHCFELALSDSTGSATMQVSTGASTAVSSLLQPHEYTKERPTVLFHPITVRTNTLDQWAEEHAVSKIDFMWLDMQGHELTVLKASSALFATAKALLIEASLTERFKGNPLYEEVLIWTESQGFKAIAQDVPKHRKN